MNGDGSAAIDPSALDRCESERASEKSTCCIDSAFQRNPQVGLQVQTSFRVNTGLHARTLFKAAGIGSIVSSIVLLAGCANLFSVFHRIPTAQSDPRTLVVDVKERAIVMAPRSTSGSGSTIVTCAEPSPDALSVLSSSLSLSGSTSPDKVLQAAAGTSEAGAFVGLRTQSIQLLRDAMYRLCEGYLAGALSEADFRDLQRRYQNVMMGLLAIEQITGAVAVRPVTLSGQAGSSTGGSTKDEEEQVTATQKQLADDKAALEDDNKKVADEQKKVSTAKADLDAANAALKADPTNDAKNTDQKTKSDAYNQEVQTLDDLTATADKQAQMVKIDQTAVDNAQEALRLAQLRVRASAQTSAQIGEAVAASKLSDASAATISSAVRDIVHDVISTSFTEESCVSYFVSVAQRSGTIDPTVAKYCSDVNALKRTEAQVKLRSLELDEQRLQR